MLSRLSSDGRAGVVLANGSMTSNTGGEGDIRTAMVKADVVECMVALPAQLCQHTNSSLPVVPLSQQRGRKERKERPTQAGFVYRCSQARYADSRLPKAKRISEAEIRQIAQTYHNWRGTQWGDGGYEDVAGFCKSATLADIEQHGFALTPGRYIGATDVEDDDEAFEEQMARLTLELSAPFGRGRELEEDVRTQLERVGYDVSEAILMRLAEFADLNPLRPLKRVQLPN